MVTRRSTPRKPVTAPTSGAPDAAQSTDTNTSVQKACRILRAMSDTRNLRLTDIALASGTDKATALRLLDALAREGFVQRDPQTKHYALGAEAFVLGAAATARLDPRPIARPSLIRLASQFEDSVILSIPRGAESVCVDVELGRFPIRATYLEVGSRRPLGAGAGSLALLAWMPDNEIDALMPTIAARLQRYPRLSAQILEQHIEQSRRRGYALMLDLIVDRMGGIAVPLLGKNRRPIAALSIAALTERITLREQALYAALAAEASACEALADRSFY